jgi:hypothetical protein
MVADRDAAAVEKALRIAIREIGDLCEDGQRDDALAILATLRREWTTAPCPWCEERLGYDDPAAGGVVPCKLCGSTEKDGRVPRELVASLELLREVEKNRDERESEDHWLGYQEAIEYGRIIARDRWLEGNAETRRWLEGNDE